MQRALFGGVVLSASAFAVPAFAQFSVGAGYEYTRGDYGKTTSTEEWRIPLSLSYRNGPWSVRLSAPWMRVKGVASALEREAHAEGDGDFIGDDDPFEGNDDPIAGNDDDDGPIDGDDDEDDEDATSGAGTDTGTGTGTGTRVGAGARAAAAANGKRPARDRRQSGFTDLTVSLFYNVTDAAASPVGFDLGARVKFPVASGDKCLLTNGATDYSVQADVYQTYGNLTPTATVGWTKRGDPDRRDINCNALPGKVDLRNPFYAGIGLGVRLSEASSLRMSYEFREKLRSTSDPKSEASLSYQHRLGDGWRLGVYGVVGFSDASPDWGLGATVAYRF